MRKIPTIFLRDWSTDRKYVTAEPNPECQWVFDGEGTPTRKYDGVCIMHDGASWFARFQLKPGNDEPIGFVPIDTDTETGVTVGWQPMVNSGFRKFHEFALRTDTELLGGKGDAWPEGTYELMGPGVSGRREGSFYYHLMEHASAAWLDVPPALDYEELKRYVLGAEIKYGCEGIVWHHSDGRMAKLKARDFPRG